MRKPKHRQKVPIRQSRFWWCVQAACVILLASVNLSTATYSPQYHPQNPNWRPAPSQEGPPQRYWGQQPRGGSTMVAQPPPAQQEVYEAPREEPFQPPKILLKHMSMALRLTSEWNRRLLRGVNRFKFWKKEPASNSEPVNVHPTRSWNAPIADPAPNVEEELTLFHAKEPRDDSSSSSASSSPNRGVARWGPELLPYLEHVVSSLGISEGVEIPLAMIYLDRACSVETPRSNGVPACPFCTPRTVHRLSLASLLLALQAVRGTSDVDMQAQYERLSSLGIPAVQLQQMVDWMRGALGDAGMMVTVPQMKEWIGHWDSIFYPKQSQQLPARPASPIRTQPPSQFSTQAR